MSRHTSTKRRYLRPDQSEGTVRLAALFNAVPGSPYAVGGAVLPRCEIDDRVRAHLPQYGVFATVQAAVVDRPCEDVVTRGRVRLLVEQLGRRSAT